jgi:hypothetical protein
MEYILENKSYYKNYISSETVEEYTENKKRDGVWGDSLEMAVFSQIFQIEILIYFYDDVPSNIIKPTTEDSNILRQWRAVVYRRCIEMNSTIEQYCINYENNRGANQNAIAFSLLYKNGNHYDALYFMSNDEYMDMLNQCMNNVRIFLKYSTIKTFSKIFLIN